MHVSLSGDGGKKMKKMKKMFYLVMTMICMHVMAYPIFSPPVSAAAQTLEVRNLSEPAGSLGGYDYSHNSKIINAIRNVEDKVDVTGFGINRDNLNNVYAYVVRMFPGMCSTPKWSCALDGNDVTEIRFTYSQDRQTVLARYQELDRVKEQVLALIDPQMTDMEKALLLHDFIISHCAYDYDNYLKEEEGTLKNLPEDDGTAYGVLVLGKGVCQGYAMAYAYLMQECGIRCLYVNSKTAEHAWNLAYLNGQWYHIDVTWDDPVWDQLGRVGHKWFAISTQTMLSYDEKKADFIITDIGGQVSLPASDQTYENGFWQHTDAAVHYYQNRWYYIDKDTFEICSYDFVTGQKKSIGNQKADKWKVWDERKIYSSSKAKTAALGSNFYYTTPNAVWRMDLDTQKQEQVFRADTSNGYLYGLGTIGCDLYYVLDKKPGPDGEQTYLPLHLNLAHAKDAHTWARADQIPATCIREGTIFNQCTKSGCTAVSKETVPIDEDAHDYVEEIKRASFHKNGSITKQCTNCKQIGSVQTIDAPETMKLSSFRFVYNQKVQKPSITILDQKGRKISRSAYRVSYDNEKSKYPGRYTVRVQFNGKYEGEISNEYQILPPKMKIEKAEGKKGAFRITWKPISGKLADGYEICYIPAGSDVQKIKHVSGTSSKQVTVKNLKKGTVYWVYLLAYKNTGEGKEPVYSIWTEGVAVTVL